VSQLHYRLPLTTLGIQLTLRANDAHERRRRTPAVAAAIPRTRLYNSNLYGRHEINEGTIGKQTIINIFIEKALANETLTVHKPGTQARDFVHVKDVTRAYECSVDALLNGADDRARTIPIASGGT